MDFQQVLTRLKQHNLPDLDINHPDLADMQPVEMEKNNSLQAVHDTLNDPSYAQVHEQTMQFLSYWKVLKSYHTA